MAETCYRHPDRETGVSCSSCGRPICPDCMTPTPVGMPLPECARQRTKVVRGPSGGASGFRQRAGDLRPDRAQRGRLPGRARIGLRAASASASGSVTVDFGSTEPLVAEGEVVPAGRPAASSTPASLHIGFNMFALCHRRPAAGAGASARRASSRSTSPRCSAGSCGALALTNPYALTVGASGAIFGLFGATLVIARGRGMDDGRRARSGFLIVLNLVDHASPFPEHQHRRPPRWPDRRSSLCAASDRRRRARHARPQAGARPSSP